jgi:hypothetical protein
MANTLFAKEKSRPSGEDDKRMIGMFATENKGSESNNTVAQLATIHLCRI